MSALLFIDGRGGRFGVAAKGRDRREKDAARALSAETMFLKLLSCTVRVWSLGAQMRREYLCIYCVVR